ncbi:MAG: FIVAR domain-containing protein [Bifidobacteriaceae bacterium]|jgi:hypothetical protein|nr:FIVAR domain-containing protein [Bifidobacteriaceae bacterium]
MKLTKKNRARAIAAAVTGLALAVSGGWLGPNDFLPGAEAAVDGSSALRRPIDNENPLFMPACAIDYQEGDNVTDCWHAIPQDLRESGIVGLELVPADGWATGRAEDIAEFQDKEKNYQRLDSWLDEYEALPDHTYAIYQISWGPNYLMTEARIEQIYQDHPSFIGVAFTEPHYRTSVAARGAEMDAQLQLAHKYGGYEFIDPIPLRSSMGAMAYYNWERLWVTSGRYPENLVVSRKQTGSGSFLEGESDNLGLWLSGHAGNYGSHPDTYGWCDSKRGVIFGPRTGGCGDFATGALGSPEVQTGYVVLQALMAGATVFTNFEFPVYSFQTWGEATPLAKNVLFPIIRKLAAGEIRIPSRDEVAAASKVGLITSSATSTSVTADPLGLYRAAVDSWTHSTGRYHSVPIMPPNTQLNRASSAMPLTLTGAEWNEAFSTMAELKAWMDDNFPAEYSGSLYAERMGNQWLAYNSQMDVETNQSALIPFQYNSADSMTLTFPANTLGVITEEAEHLDVYLSNYVSDHAYLWDHQDTIRQVPGIQWKEQSFTDYMRDIVIPNTVDAELRSATIRIDGAAEKPTFAITDIGYKDNEHDRSRTVYEAPIETYVGGIWTLSVNYNGALDISIDAKGGTAKTGPAEPAPPTALPVKSEAPPTQIDLTNTYTQNSSFGLASDAEKRFQTFTANSYPKLKGIDVKMTKDPGNRISIVPDLVVGLYATDSNVLPTGAALASSTIPAAEVDKGSVLHIDWSSLEIALTPGAHYAIVASTPTLGGSYYGWHNNVTTVASATGEKSGKWYNNGWVNERYPANVSYKMDDNYLMVYMDGSPREFLEALYEAKKDIAQGTGLDSYLDESWQEFQAALAQALQTINDLEATDNEIGQATTRLQNAVDGLRHYNADPLIDLSFGDSGSVPVGFGSDGSKDSVEERRAQTFTANWNPWLDSVSVKLRKLSADTTGDVLVSLYGTDGDGKPTGAALATATVPGNLITTTMAEYIVDLGYRGLQTGARYAIVVAQDPVAPYPNNYQWWMSSTAKPSNTTGEWSWVDLMGVAWREESRSAWLKVNTSGYGQTYKADLQAAVDYASALAEADYSTVSWAVLEAALEAGQVALENPDATQEAVDEAEQALLDAIDGLVALPKPPPVVSGVLVSGDVKVNGVLSVEAVVEPSDAVLSYQWFADGEPIAAATDDEYRLGMADMCRSVSVVVTATSAGGSDSASGSASGVLRFSDTSASHAGYAPICWLAREGVSIGTAAADGTVKFQPHGYVYRYALGQFLYRLAGSPAYEPPAGSAVADIAPSSEFYKAVTWAAENGLFASSVNGQGKLVTSASAVVTRGEFASVFAEFGKKFGNAKGLTYYDAPSGVVVPGVAADSPYYAGAAWLLHAGITRPDASGYNPGAYLQRWEFATFALRHNQLNPSPAG